MSDKEKKKEDAPKDYETGDYYFWEFDIPATPVLIFGAERIKYTHAGTKEPTYVSVKMHGKDDDSLPQPKDTLHLKG